MTVVRVCTIGAPSDYKTSLIPAICRSLGYEISWVKPQNADLIIAGPFNNRNIKSLAWCPKPLRPSFSKINEIIQLAYASRQSKPPVLFQTGENLRCDFMPHDFSITFDLGVSAPNHFRMPYWMEMVDWSKDGVTGNLNPRYGCLLSLDRLLQPLGNEFLSRPLQAAIFASHLREPRQTLLGAVKKQIEVIEYGRSFNPNIKNHLESGIVKFKELQKVAFNLCPENGMYPGYYTEKIPEAFMAGCLPITWVDENVQIDFNPKAFINLAPMSLDYFSDLENILNSKNRLLSYSEQALLLERPSIEPLKNFVKEIFKKTIS
jgi:hypothetical protein